MKKLYNFKSVSIKFLLPKLNNHFMYIVIIWNHFMTLKQKILNNFLNF